MSNVRFKPNHAAFAAMAVGPEMTAIVLAEAERAKAIAEGLSADFTVTGDYESSFRVETEIVSWDGEYPSKRVAGVLHNDSDHAAAVEWGYHGRARDPGSKAHRVLGRTLDALGHD